MPMITELWYSAPGNLEEALQLLQEDPPYLILAGGTDLMVQYYDAREKMGRVLDISRLEELKGVEIGQEKVFLGSLTTHEQIYRNRELQKLTPLLSRAAGTVGATQIRNQGTLGGNLANASPAADLAPPLIALEAKVMLVGPRGERSFNLDEFFSGPGETRKNPEEIIKGVEFPSPRGDFRGVFLKVGQRRAMAIAVASLAIGLTCKNGTCEEIRLACGSVAPVPLRARKTEEILRGKKLEELPVEEAAGQLEKEANPIDDIRGTAEYRSRVLGNLLRKGLQEILSQKGVSANG